MESVLSIFDSDPKMGEQLMSMTPPADMDSLFPELASFSKTTSPEVMNPDDDLTQYLIGNNDVSEVCIPATTTLGVGLKQAGSDISKANGCRVVKVFATTPINQVKQSSVSADQYLEDTIDVENDITEGEQLSPRWVQSPANSEEDSVNGGKRMTKSAIAARENRLRKKNYVASLESKVSVLTTENEELKNSISAMSKREATFKTEIEYLRSALANDSALSTLLRNIPGTPGIRLRSSESFYDDQEEDSTPLVQTKSAQKRKAVKPDHDYSSRKVKKSQVSCKDTKNAGCCIYVNGSTTSLEFCEKCYKKAERHN